MPSLLLTNAFVTSTTTSPPTSGRTEYWDTKSAGLCLRVSSTGAASWSFRYRPRDGAGYQRITLGPLSDLKLADARERADRLRVEVTDGADPQGERQAKRIAASNELTFAQLADRYIEEYAKPSKASWKNDQLYLARPRKAWEWRKAKSITRRDVITLLDQIKRSAPVSANRTQSVLVTLFNWSVDDHLLDANPIAGLKKRAKEQPKERALSDGEIRVVWNALNNTDLASEDIAAALKLILLTGQRPGECAGTAQSELRDMNKPAQAIWEIPSHRTKARRPHIVPLNSMALDLLSMTIRRGDERLESRKRANGWSEVPTSSDVKSVFASRFSNRTTLARHSLSQGLGRLINNLVAEGPDTDAVRTLQDDPPTPHDSDARLPPNWRGLAFRVKTG